MSQLVYRKDIDGLRGFAIIIALLFHYFPTSSPHGFMGADIFFVISGYLITRIIQENWQREDFFSWFFLRRIRRLFPSLILVVYTTLLLGSLLLFSLEFENLLRHLASAATYTSNILLGSEVNYFHPDSSKKPLLHLWSLAVEEQFYILWPIIIFTSLKFRLKPVIPILLLLVSSFLYFSFKFKYYSLMAYYDTLARGWELLIGCLISQIHLKRKSNMFSWTGVILILFGIIDLPVGFDKFLLLFPVFGTACVILGSQEAWVNQRCFSLRALVWMGLISYPVYLWHWPLLSFTRIVLEGPPNFSIRMFLLFLSVLLGWLTTKFLEVPIRNRPLSFRRSMLFVTPLLILLMLGAPAHFRHFSMGFNRNGHPPQDEALAKICDSSHFSDIKCEIYDSSRSPTVVLFGDSFADHHFPGISRELARHGENVLSIVRFACVPVMNIRFKSSLQSYCEELIDPVFAYILNEASIHTVYFGHRPIRRNAELKVNPKYTYIENYEIALTQTLEAFLAKKKVIFLYGIPELSYEVTECLNTKMALGRTARNCRIGIEKYHDQQKEFRPVLERIFAALPTMKVLRPDRYLCDEKFCHFTHNNELLYKDQIHLSYAGSLYLAKQFFNEISN